MDIAVRVKEDKKHSHPFTLIVKISDETLLSEDIVHDACHDEVQKHLCEDPKWIRIEGFIKIIKI